MKRWEERLALLLVLVVVQLLLLERRGHGGVTPASRWDGQRDARARERRRKE